jgi:signal transduction histidine kinase
VTAHGLRPQTRDRIETVVEQLDTTIRDIRGAIFELRSPASGGLRNEIHSLVEEARGSLGFRPRFVIDGPIDSAVPDALGPAVIAVLREALSNAARHARASTVTVEVTALAGILTLRVVDDGIGIPADVGSVGGLRNMRRRAEEYGGTCVIDAVEPHGTAMTWTAPLEGGRNIPD